MGKLIRADFVAKRRLPDEPHQSFLQAKARLTRVKPPQRSLFDYDVSLSSAGLLNREALIQKAANAIVTAETICDSSKSLAADIASTEDEINETAYQALDEALSPLSDEDVDEAWAIASQIISGSS